jgi:hypothetical protein
MSATPTPSTAAAAKPLAQRPQAAVAPAAMTSPTVAYAAGTSSLPVRSATATGEAHAAGRPIPDGSLTQRPAAGDQLCAHPVDVLLAYAEGERAVPPCRPRCVGNMVVCEHCRVEVDVS